jgi:hypothetical protein
MRKPPCIFYIVLVAAVLVMVASAMFWLGVMADCKKPNNDEHYAVKLPEYNRSSVRHDEIFLDKLVIEHEQEVEGLTRNITSLLQAVAHYEKLETFKKKEKTDAASDDVTKHPFASDEKTVTHHATPKEYADIFIAPHPLITSSKAIIDSAALIMPQFNAKREFKGALCRFADNQTVEKGVPVQPNEKTRIYERASADEQTFTTTTIRSKNASTVGTAAVSFEQL